MPTLLLAFANSSTNPLPTLRDEDEGVNKVLIDRISKNDFIVQREQFASTSTIINDLQQFKDDIVLFLYSGHAGRDALLLDNNLAQADGIAALLGQCPELKLVILNGCSTGGQVETLFKNNVPAVIATSAPIDDRKATQFSISFFQELAQNRSTIHAAFDTAVAAAKVLGTINAEVRTIGTIDQPPADASWGLYYKDDKSDLLDWRLPEKQPDAKANTYLNNVINTIYKDYENVLKDDAGDVNAQGIILQRIPFSISESLRKLLAPGDSSGQIFYDSPSPQRYGMLLYAYKSIISFCTFVLLAQLWEEISKTVNKPDIGNLSTSLRNWLISNTALDDNQSLMPLFSGLMTFMNDNKVPHFITELPAAFTQLNQSEYKVAFDYLENQLKQNPQNNLDYLCDDTEKNLAVVLYAFKFLIHYGLTSIKDINVLFYMNYKVPDFEHKIVKLQQAVTDLEDRTESDTTYFKTSSIVLRRVDDKTKQIYLSPFFIDENAYNQTPKAKLCYFTAYSAVNKQFKFRHVSKPDDIIVIQNVQQDVLSLITGDATSNINYFPLIHEQFSAFCNDVLGKDIDEL